MTPGNRAATHASIRYAPQVHASGYKVTGWALIAGVAIVAAVHLTRQASTPAFDPGPYPAAQVDENGIVRQTTRMSCAPAAAATLLRKLGVDTQASEAQLAALCRTHPQAGTPDPDLRAGIEEAAGRPALLVRHTLAQLRARTEPCIVFVSLDRERAGSDTLYRLLRDECGWPEGEAHAVVFLGLEPGEDGEEQEVAVVGDPRTGLERWGITHFTALWDRRLIEVSPAR